MDCVFDVLRRNTVRARTTVSRSVTSWFITFCASPLKFNDFLWENLWFLVVKKLKLFEMAKTGSLDPPISPWWYPGGKDLQADSQQSEIQGGSWIHLIWLVIYWHMRQWKRVFYTDSSMLRHTGIAYDMICKTIHLINDRSSSDILHDIVHLTHTSGHDTIYMMIW